MTTKLTDKNEKEIRYLYCKYYGWSYKYTMKKLAQLYSVSEWTISKVLHFNRSAGNSYTYVHKKMIKCIGCKQWFYKRSFTTRQLKTPAPLCRTCYKRQFVRAYRYTYVWNSCYICGSIFRKHKGSKQFLCKNPECSDKYFNKGIRI